VTRLGALIAAFLLAVVPACREEAGPEPTGDPARNAGTSDLLPITVDELPPTSPQEYRRLLDDLKGTPVVVNFWASWCVPCETEVPLFVDAANRYGDRIQFLGVDIEDTRGPAIAFIRRHRMPYPSLFDPYGAIRDSEGSFGQPVTAFYDARGGRVLKIDGPISKDQLERELQMLAQRTS
jgi:thiol-disulfide isomerase/thioredoxin